VTKQDFIDWKRHPVTQIVFSQLEALVAQRKEELAWSAGQDTYKDARTSGSILGLYELLNIEFEEPQ
jgi:hypothetical protein